jgi:hypothetical protein
MASTVVGQFEFLLCHPRAWLPREGSRIPGFLARQTKQTRGNDKKVRPKLTHYGQYKAFRNRARLMVARNSNDFAL